MSSGIQSHNPLSKALISTNTAIHEEKAQPASTGGIKSINDGVKHLASALQGDLGAGSKRCFSAINSESALPSAKRIEASSDAINLGISTLAKQDDPSHSRNTASSLAQSLIGAQMAAQLNPQDATAMPRLSKTGTDGKASPVASEKSPSPTATGTSATATTSAQPANPAPTPPNNHANPQDPQSSQSGSTGTQNQMQSTNALEPYKQPEDISLAAQAEMERAAQAALEATITENNTKIMNAAFENAKGVKF